MKRFIILFLLIFLVGCNKTAVDNPDVFNNEIAETSNEQNFSTFQNNVDYKPYTREEYELTLSEGKFVFLNFYANWCPICKRERPDVVNALEEIDRNDLVAFEVNYNDGETDDNEKMLAKKLGVTYQHTKIIIDKNEKEIFRTLEILNKKDLKNKILNYLP